MNITHKIASKQRIVNVNKTLEETIPNDIAIIIIIKKNALNPTLSRLDATKEKTKLEPQSYGSIVPFTVGNKSLLEKNIHSLISNFPSLIIPSNCVLFSSSEFI